MFMNLITKKSFLLFLMLFVLIRFDISLQGTFHYLGSDTLKNTATTYPSIYGNDWLGVKNQFLIKASELQASGISAGIITGIAFDIASKTGNDLDGFEIQMKSTSDQTISTWDNNNLVTHFGPSLYTDQVGWSQHDFTTPFYWDGSSNIIIQTCFFNSVLSQNAVMNMTDYGYNTLIYRRRSSSSPCNSNWINGVETKRPNIRFKWLNPNSPPITNFSVDNPVSCNGTINFFDQSANSPSSWLWYFGDGTSSNLENPVHNYTSPGNFTITLITSNSFGSDTLILNNLIQVNLTTTPPLPASCTPTTGIAGLNGNYGISKFSFGALNNSSGSSSDGFSDFTCDSTLFYVGETYALSAVHTSAIPQNFFAWIDYNNNGVFEVNSEEIVSNLNSGDSTNSTIQIPSSAVVNTPLRMRIMSDASFSGQLNPCSNPVYGQAEDYTIYFAYNFNPPISNFESNKNYSCDGVIEFHDLSSNIPYSWFWDFGDGGTSIFENPTHTFNNNGFYDISLITTNSFGSDTITYNQFIEVDSTNYIAPFIDPNTGGISQPSTLDYCCEYGISRVEFSDVNNLSMDGIEGYVDYSCDLQAIVEAGSNYFLKVSISGTIRQNTRAWIDFNNDLIFTPNEIVMQKDNELDPVSIVQIPANISTNIPLKLRISSDEVGNNNGPYDNVNRGQVEDYSIIVSNCENPGNVQLGQVSNSSVELNWTAGGNESAWNIKYGPSVLGGLDTTINNVTVNNYIITGLNESTTYDFYLQSICDINTSTWLGPFSTTTLDIDNDFISQKLYIYPNPNYKIFNIKSSLIINSVSILDILGKTVEVLNPNKKMVEIDIMKKPSGIYFLKVNLSSGITFTKKILCK